VTLFRTDSDGLRRLDSQWVKGACDLTETAAAASRGTVSRRAGLPAMQKTAQLGGPRRNSMIAAQASPKRGPRGS
jgi:hypothetical protein